MKIISRSLVFTVMPVALLAQTAQIDGTVADSTSAVMPGAAVSVTNVETGGVRNTVSNKDGYYALPLLQPGKYNLTVKHDGFRPVIHDGLVLAVNQNVRIDIVMQVGTVTESLEVNAAAPLLETDTANTGQVIENKLVTGTPLNIRNPMFLLTLSPGVVTGPNFAASTSTQSTRNFFQADFRVGGGRSMGQEILLDGITDTTGDRFASVIPPVDSVEEFKVQMNTYSAEYGHTSGGIVNMITRSGSNQVHGTAYDFLRNSVFDSNSFFSNRAGIKLASFKRNQFGGNLGGPVYLPRLYHGKDKTFFFVAYEGLRQSSPANYVSTVPTALQRQGDFSQTFAANGQQITIFNPFSTAASGTGFVRTAFPGNVIPASLLNPSGLKVLNFYPLPNAAGQAITNVNNYVVAPSATASSDLVDVRLDHSISQNQRIFGRISRNKNTHVTAGPFPGSVGSNGGADQIDTYWQGVVDYSATLSPNTIFDTRVGANRAHAVVLPLGFPFDVSQLGFNSAYQQIAVPMFPNISVSGLTSLGGQSYNGQPRNSYEYTINFTKILGRQTIKTGFDYRILQLNSFQNTSSGGNYTFNSSFTQGPNPAVASATAGYGLASLLLGTGTGDLTVVSALALERLYYAGYVQDDIKVTRKLTLNVGLRYEVSPGISERYNRLNWFDPSVRSPIASQAAMPGLNGALIFAGNGQPRNQFDTNYNSFGPRFGFAYQATKHLVIRGGYGVTYAPMFLWPEGVDGFNTDTTWVSSLNGFNPINLFSNPFPQGFVLPSAKGNPLTDLGQNVIADVRSEITPMIQQWNISVQRQLASNLLLEVMYWGNHGTHLENANGFQLDGLSSQYYSLGTALSQLVPNPFYGVITTGTVAAAQVTRRQLLLPYPQYTSVLLQVPDAADSNYHAGTVRLERRFQAGLSLLASYTYAKTIDNSDSNLRASDQSGQIENWQNRAAERSVSAFNIPQRFILSAGYELPVGRGKPFAAHLPAFVDTFVGGWQLNGFLTVQNGLPLALTAGAGPIPEFSSLRPNSTGVSAALSDPSIYRWFNTSDFTQPAPYTFGNVGRLLPDVHADGVKNLDLSLLKNFAIKERLHAQFRFESFNLVNHAIFSAPSGSLTSSSFGVVSAQANAPRQIQMALKLVF